MRFFDGETQSRSHSIFGSEVPLAMFIFCFQDKQLKNWTLKAVWLIFTASFHLTLSPLFHLGVQIHHHNQLHRAIMWADALDAWGNTGHSMLARDWSRAAESAIWLVGGATGYMVGCSGWWLPGYCHNHCPLWPPSMEEMGRKGELSLFRREERSNWNFEWELLLGMGGTIK